MTPLLPHFTSPLIPTPHGFFTRKGGVSLPPQQGLNTSFFVHDNQNHVCINRHILAQHFRVPPQKILFAHQVHSSRVCIIRRTEPWSSKPLYTPHADALVTNIPLIALGITTADCVPILLIDPIHHVIGAIHGGWRGLLSHIIENTIHAMITLGASPSSLRAAIGPCIALHSYPIGPLVLSHLPPHTQHFAPLIQNSHHLNLTALTRFLLIQQGLHPLHISLHSHRNTFSHPHTFFSSRYAQKQTKTSSLSPPKISHGCQASLIALHTS